LAGKRETQSERTDFLREVKSMAANNRAKGLAATAELRRLTIAMTSAAGALLLHKLLTRESNLGATFGLVCTGLTLGELPCDHAVQNVGARLKSEHFVCEINGTSRLRIKRLNVDLHHAPSFGASASSAGASAGASTAAAGAAASSPCRRNAPGTGAPSGSLPFTAS